MKKLEELDSLRAVMALLVYVSHVQVFAGLRIAHFEIGGMAVTVFVILSGFAISLSLLQTQAGYRRYLARRFFRIYPIYAVGLVLGIATSFHLPELAHSLGWIDADFIQSFDQREASKALHPVSHLLAHVLLLHGAIPDAVLPSASLTFNGPAWSLSLEWQFYLIAPALLGLLLWMLRLPLAARLASIGAYLLGMAVLRHETGPLFTQVPSFVGIQLPFFTLGILTAIFQTRLAASTRLAMAGSAGCVLVSLASRNLNIVIPVLIWVSTLWIAFSNRQGICAASRSALTARWLVRAGEASYSFYILHMPLLIFWAVTIHRLWPSLDQSAFAMLLCTSFPVICLLSWLTYTRLESPVNTWAKRRFGAPPR